MSATADLKRRWSMSNCEQEISADKTCNCCNDDTLKTKLSSIQKDIENLTSAQRGIQQQLSNLTAVPAYTNAKGESLAINACLVTCSDVDTLERSIDDVGKASRYRLKDCSGADLENGDKVASCGDLNGIDEKIKNLGKQINEAQKVANQALNSAQQAEQSVGRVNLGSSIDTNSLNGLLSRMSELEKQLTETNSKLGSVAADVEAGKSQ